MNIEIFSIHDSKTEAFMQPFYARTVEEAKRAFGAHVNNSQPGNQIADHPGDFTLFKIGEFNDSTGQMTPTEKFSLGNALEYKIQTQETD